jgi:hypothetical protein
VLQFREAAGFEGFIVLAVIYFILSQLQKAGKRANQSRQAPAAGPGGQPSATQREGLSLETILKEIERVKQQQMQRPDVAYRPLPDARSGAKPLPARRPSPPKRPQVAQDDRGPLGRHSQTRLPSAEEVEELATFDEGRSLEDTETVEGFDADRSRRTRVRVDADEQAEAVVQERLRAVQARNQPHQAADHRAFDQGIRAGGPAAMPALRFTNDRLREAFIWREILGPPKALDE